MGIAGAGGLGSNCAAMLVRSGIRRFVLVDFDVVEPSNLNRQWYYPEDVGSPKVEALARHLRRLEPDLELTIHQVRLDEWTVPRYFAGCDAMVEALDDPGAKAMFVNAALPHSPLLVSASGLAGTGGEAMSIRRVTSRLVMVGDGVTEVTGDKPPLAPRGQSGCGYAGRCHFGVLSTGGVSCIPFLKRIFTPLRTAANPLGALLPSLSKRCLLPESALSSTVKRIKNSEKC